MLLNEKVLVAYVDATGNAFGRRLSAAKVARLSLNLARKLALAGKHTEAILQCDLAIALSPSARAYAMRARVKACLQLYSEALNDMDDAIRLVADSEDHRQYVYIRAILHWHLQKWDEVLAGVEHAIRSGVCNQDVLLLKAASLHAMGRWVGEKEVLNFLCNSFPDFIPGRMHLVLLLAAAPVADIRDGNRAVEIIRAMLTNAPNDWRIASIAAAAYAEKGDFPTAIRLSNQALTACPEEFKAEQQKRLNLYGLALPYRFEALASSRSIPL